MLKKITIDQARVGMYVDKLDGTWIDNPFWRPSFMIVDAAMLAQLRSGRIRALWIDTGRGADIGETPDSQGVASEGDESGPAPGTADSGSSVDRAEERAAFDEAARLLERSRETVQALFEEVRQGRLAAAARAAPVVDEIAASVMRNPRVLISLARLKHTNEYTYMHTIAVCALMIALARQLGLDEAAMRECGTAGLLHDIGKLSIPLTLLDKPGSLGDDEYEIIKNHPRAGWRLMQQIGGLSPIVEDVCLHHHERMDGHGYPDRLRGAQIGLYARMAAICDVYDAITSDRPYKAAWSPVEALRRMAEWTSFGQFDRKIFTAFVNCIGIYPIGTLLRLKSDKLAVVTDNSHSLLKPVVRIFFSVDSVSPITPHTVDLNCDGIEEAIDSYENPGDWNMSESACFSYVRG